MAARTSTLALVAGLAAAAALALSASAAADARAASSGPEAARFSLTVDGVEIASFSQLDRSVPGSVVLQRGVAPRSSSLWAWHEAVLRGDILAARRSAAIVVYDYEGKPVARYDLEHAWPSKIEIGGLKAGSSEIGIESITLCHEGFEIR